MQMLAEKSMKSLLQFCMLLKKVVDPKSWWILHGFPLLTLRDKMEATQNNDVHALGGRDIEALIRSCNHLGQTNYLLNRQKTIYVHKNLCFP